MRDDGPPHIIVEPGYWRDPTQVFTGMTWLIIGIGVGLAVSHFVL